MNTITTSNVKSAVTFGPFGKGGEVAGFTEDAWQGVRGAFETNFALNLELGAQLVIWKDGEVVVDLTGKSPKQPNYSPDTLQCVFSSGKNMEAISMAMLVDRGLVSYDDLVCKHWPEYGQHGKAGITVANVMRHEGGCPYFANPEHPTDASKDTPMQPEWVRDVEKMERLFENSARSPQGKNPRMYHAFTRGWIVNGLLRRVDPKGRSLGQFIKEEISDPLEIAYYCGMPEEEQSKHQLADMKQIPKLYNVIFEVLPAMVGRGDPQLTAMIKLCSKKSSPLMRKPVAWMKDQPTPEFNNTAEGRALEIPSAGMFTNARSMARANAAMAGDGSVGGARLLSKEGVERAMAHSQDAMDVSLETRFAFTQGGFCNFGLMHSEDQMVHEDDPLAYKGMAGWCGWGGSLSVWNREHNLAFSYTMNGMSNDLMGGLRTRTILLEVQRVLGGMRPRA
jgi:CubicO group peptidase (beta-lactamase class C family)